MTDQRIEAQGEQEKGDSLILLLALCCKRL